MNDHWGQKGTVWPAREESHVAGGTTYEALRLLVCMSRSTSRLSHVFLEEPKGARGDAAREGFCEGLILRASSTGATGLGTPRGSKGAPPGAPSSPTCRTAPPSGSGPKPLEGVTRGCLHFPRNKGRPREGGKGLPRAPWARHPCSHRGCSLDVGKLAPQMAFQPRLKRRFLTGAPRRP